MVSSVQGAAVVLSTPAYSPSSPACPHHAARFLATCHVSIDPTESTGRVRRQINHSQGARTVKPSLLNACELNPGVLQLKLEI